ncbi:Serine/threonine-protein kinase dclk1 [Homalodisca vitripennis]|nr:Serine/threonine-protein kinase dclk1 [Homalodisca vitripennis]
MVGHQPSHLRLVLQKGISLRRFLLLGKNPNLKEDVWCVVNMEGGETQCIGVQFVRQAHALKNASRFTTLPLTFSVSNQVLLYLGRGVPKLPNKTKSVKGSRRQDSNPSIPSKVLSRYSVGLIIGDGNFAVVRRCFDKVKGAELALKIIDKSKCAGKEHMIDNEVAILRSVQHPNIIRLVAEHDTPAELYLVMELVKVSKMTCFTNIVSIL